MSGLPRGSLCCFFFFVCLFVCFFELGTEPRALRLLGKHSTIEPNPQPSLCCFDHACGENKTDKIK